LNQINRRGSIVHGKQTAFLVIYQLADANATEVAANVKKAMAKLALRFPDGLEYAIPYDTTKFITRSIDEVIVTLLQAIALVILVVFLFLQNWRATIIPSIAIVVIENVERILKQKKLPIKEAVTKAMEQVSGPIIATTLVLLAVFVPVAFMPGITGELYKQFLSPFLLRY
jgi:HAE1 family hydrophobic/amphiphilic exporter-1